MTETVVPRPIAVVTSLDAADRLNASRRVASHHLSTTVLCDGVRTCTTKRKPLRAMVRITSDRWRLFGPAESGCDRVLSARGYPDVVNRRAADPEPPRDL